MSEVGLIGLFIAVVAVYAAYMIGTLVGYKDCINKEESKKGVQQYSRMPYNERF